MAARQPNILLIITDSQGFDTIAALDNPIIRTPSLDRLVREGTSFTSAYTPSPMCVPARCALLYGQAPSRTGCYDNVTGMPTDGRPSFVDALSEAGYRTHAVGEAGAVDRDDADAERALQAMLRSIDDPDDATRLCIGDWCLARGAELCAEHGLPMKIHTGTYGGNNRLFAERIAAGHLCPLLVEYPDTRFVLMHVAYPCSGARVAEGEQREAHRWRDQEGNGNRAERGGRAQRREGCRERRRATIEGVLDSRIART